MTISEDARSSAGSPGVLTPERPASAVIDAILHGMTVEEIAAKVAGGSIVRVLEIMAEGINPADLRNLIQFHELHCSLSIERLKTEALLTLASIMTGAIFREFDHPITSDDLRIIELRRRACNSILRLNPLPTRRDSAPDAMLTTLRAENDGAAQAAAEVARPGARATAVAGFPRVSGSADVPSAPHRANGIHAHDDSRTHAPAAPATDYHTGADAAATQSRASQIARNDERNDPAARTKGNADNCESPLPNSSRADEAAAPPLNRAARRSAELPSGLSLRVEDTAEARRLSRLQQKSLRNSRAGSSNGHPP